MILKNSKVLVVIFIIRLTEMNDPYLFESTRED
jgi:hypothetical protein